MKLAGNAMANRIELTLRFVATNFSRAKDPEITNFTERDEHMNETMNDLQHNVQAALMNDTQTKEYGIEVLDSNGIITLRGAVPSHEARDKVEAVVREVAGVTGVINELDVIA